MVLPRDCNQFVCLMVVLFITHCRAEGITLSKITSIANTFHTSKLINYDIVLCYTVRYYSQLDAGPDIDVITNKLLKQKSVETLLDCTKLFIGDIANTSLFISQSSRYPAKLNLQQHRPVLLATNLTNNRLATVIGQQVPCLTTILNTDKYNMKDLASLSKTLNRHIIFKSGGRKPSSRELMMIDRPMVWIEEAVLVR